MFLGVGEGLEEEMSKVSLIPEKINTSTWPEVNRQSGGAHTGPHVGSRIFVCVCVCVCVCVYVYICRERETERERERERQADRQTDRQTETNTERQKKYQQISIFLWFLGVCVRERERVRE